VAAEALEPLVEAAPAMLAAFAQGLEFAPQVQEFGPAIESLAVDRERGLEGPGPLTLLLARRALRRAALFEPGLIARLADSQSPFWTSVGDALAVVAEDLLPA
jgi:hypothetical protein